MIWNSNLRFNLDDPTYREAYENLHGMDRKKYRSCNRVIAVAVNEYFNRERKSERDPYFETREREEQFISEIISAVGEAVREAMPGFMATYIMSNSWGGAAPVKPVESAPRSSSAAEDSYAYIDFDFVGEQC